MKMSFTMVAWTQDIAIGATVDLDGVPDQHITIDGDSVRVPGFAPNLMGMYVNGTTIDTVQISAPSLREELLVDVSPVHMGSDIPGNDPPFLDLTKNPIPLVPSEGLRVQVENTGAGLDRARAIAILGDDITGVPPGRINTVRLDGTQATVADVWTNCPLTITQQLEAGRYAIVGMRAEGTTIVAARIVAQGTGYRPGCLGVSTAALNGLDIFRRGGLGVWAEFEHTFLPSIEVLTTNVNNAQTVYLDIVKI